MNWLKQNAIPILLLVLSGSGIYSSLNSQISVMEERQNKFSLFENDVKRTHITLGQGMNALSDRVTAVESRNEQLIESISQLVDATNKLNESTAKLAISVAKLEVKVEGR